METTPTTAAVPLAAPRRLAETQPLSSTATDAHQRLDGSVPLRMPAILRLQQPKGGAAPKRDSKGNESVDDARRKAARPGHGKRRQRRYENGDPGPYMKDLSTKFAPPPKSFSRSTYISSTPADAPSEAALAASAEAGHFAMSLRGLRRTLRMATGGPRTRRGDGGATEQVLEIMERELSDWLGMSGRIPEGFYHDSTAAAAGASSLRQAVSRGKLLDSTPLDDVFLPLVEQLPDLPTHHEEPQDRFLPTLTELARQPHTLVWLAPSPHHRFLLHCLARYYDLSSFSRPLSPLEPDVRVTHVLRPQLVRPRAAGHHANTELHHGLETPPGTDWSTAGGTTTEGELTATDVDTPSATDDDDTTTDDGSSESDAVEWREAPVAGAATDDEAEAVYSSATDSDDLASDAGGIDSLASSFADLSATASAVVSGTPRRSPTPAFVSIGAGSPGSATPTPLARPAFAPSPIGAASAAETPRPHATTTERGRAITSGRRSLPATNGYTSTESSPSRSPTRAGAGTTSNRGVYVGTAAGEWKLPARRFVDWVYD
ncbi:hypothetical protein C6P46_004836 [Rhodotorula mucilaginosa]|uniref:R3H-associated N-terminal domain-containing protein n=1 Tax=Rhodotorula mucilaginosa TaxID=5537 RepID=A0A9P6W1L6_RHOMI|nr:hypothetical protein C6P46_004836 [Rhodotorula mucilaginosa]